MFKVYTVSFRATQRNAVLITSQTKPKQNKSPAKEGGTFPEEEGERTCWPAWEQPGDTSQISVITGSSGDAEAHLVVVYF